MFRKSILHLAAQIIVGLTGLATHAFGTHTEPTTKRVATADRLFIENRGQIIDQNNRPATDVRYLVQANAGLNVQLRASGFSYDTYATRTIKADEAYGGLVPLNASDLTVFDFHRVDVTFIGAASNHSIEAFDASADHLNYYTTGTSDQGVQGVRGFGRVVYKGLYPGIDLEFVAADGRFKYNFIVHPGADPTQIRWRYAGQNASKMDQNSQIGIQIAHGQLSEEIPASWSQPTGRKVNVSFVQLGNDEYGFRVESAYDRNQTLVIDPLPGLSWSTYYGGTGNDRGNDVAVGQNSVVYMTGQTFSGGNMATTGAYQASIGQNGDAFLTKFNKDGVRQWATYLGGNQLDSGEAVAVDNSEDVYMGGYSGSNNVTMSGGHQTTFGGVRDGFIAKFNSDGAIIWSTFFGGTSIDEIYDLDTDVNHVYAAGRSFSTSGIATPGTHQTERNDNYDAFVAKFALTGTRVWGTYLGGELQDNGYGVGADENGNVYLSGHTVSETGIATPGSHQEVRGANSTDAFVTKFNSTGNVIWSTYYGGGDPGGSGLEGQEENIRIAVRPNGRFFVGGKTTSTSDIAFGAGAFQTFNGVFDAFVARFNTDGQLLWGSYFGGGSQEYFGAIDDDNQGNAYITGYTNSTAGIATAGAYKTSLSGLTDGYVAKFNRYGQLEWSSYFGGSGEEESYGVALRKANHIYMTGVTTTITSNGLATPGAHQETYSGPNNDAFLAKLTGCDQVPQITVTTNSPVCEGDLLELEVTAIDSAEYVWNGPNGSTEQGLTWSIADAGTDLTGVFGVTLTDTLSCETTATADVLVKPLPDINVSTTFLTGSLYSMDSEANHQWFNCGTESQVPGAQMQGYMPLETGDYAVILELNGCVDTSACVNMVVSPVGISDYATEMNWSVFPNPTDDMLTISCPMTATFEVKDLSGRRVMSLSTSESRLKASADLAAGTYIVQRLGTEQAFKVVVY